MPRHADQWMSLKDIADELNIALTSLYAMRTKGVGPRGHKIGKHVRVRRGVFEVWLASRLETGA